MPIADWTKRDDWEVLYLAGQRMAGLAVVDVKLGSGLDVKKPKGGSKATIRDEGTPPSTLRITIKLNPTELETFQRQIPLLRPRSIGGARDPLEIGHPQARIWGIHVVTIGEIDAPQPETGELYIVTFDATEWAPGPKKVKASKKKPEDDSGWDVQKLINDNRPSRTGAAQKNF